MRPLAFLLFIIGIAGQAAKADLLVVSRDTQAILAYDQSSGAYTRIFASGHGLQSPEAIALGPDGKLYIADGLDSNVVLRFDGATGTFIDAFVHPGSGGLSAPRDLAFGPDGNLYVSSHEKNQVLVFDGTTGTFQKIFSSANISSPRGIAFHDGDVFIASEDLNDVLRYHMSGVLVGVFAVDPRLQSPREMIFGPDGNLYISSSENNLIMRFNGTTGASMGIFASGGGLNFPRGLAFGPDGNLYVASAGADTVLRFNGATGAFVDVFASGGGASFPTGILFTSSPTFVAAGVTNGASFASGMSPGALATIFGTGLSTVSGVLSATTKPLPTKLLTTSVTVNGIAAPLFTIVNVEGREQINFQVPFEVAGQTSAPVVVTNGVFSSQPVETPVSAAQPGIFTIGGVNAAALHAASYSLISAASPAAKKEVIVVFVTGLGTVRNPPGTGNPASSTTLSRTSLPATATIGGKNAHVIFSGLAPTFIGLYQVNCTVPPDADSGSDDLIVTVNGVASNTAKIAIQ